MYELLGGISEKLDRIGYLEKTQTRGCCFLFCWPVSIKHKRLFNRIINCWTRLFLLLFYFSDNFTQYTEFWGQSCLDNEVPLYNTNASKLIFVLLDSMKKNLLSCVMKILEMKLNV